MQAEIITIGDEILIGQTVDTNSAWLGQELSLRGISVFRITSVSDKKSEILNCYLIILYLQYHNYKATKYLYFHEKSIILHFIIYN